MQLNRVPAAQALLPAVSVRADGLIGVLYYDMRNDTPDPATLLVDAWLATSADGVDLDRAPRRGSIRSQRRPDSRGRTVHRRLPGLASTDGEFVPFFAHTNGDPSNRTDIFAAVFRSIGPAAAAAAKARYAVRAAAPLAMTSQWQQRLQRSVMATLRSRLIGGSGVPGTPPARAP